MGKTQRALTSLIAAIPAGVLSYLLVMVFLSKADSLKTITQVLAGTTLLCSGLVTLMPFGLLIFGGKKAAADDEGKTAGKKSDVDDEDVDVEDEGVEAVSDLEEVEETEEGDDSASAFDVEESDADIMADSDDDLSGPASSLDEIESVDFDDEEEEEKPAPKKRKK